MPRSDIGLTMPEPSAPDLAVPMALAAGLVVLYFVCAGGVFFSRAWGSWLTIVFMVVSVGDGKTGSLGLFIAIALILYSALRLGGVVGPKSTWH